MAQNHIEIASGSKVVSVLNETPTGEEYGLAVRNILPTITLGIPQLVNSSGTTTIYTPTSGKRIRLKWFAMATPESNSQAVIVTVNLSGNNLYIWPLGAPGAFMHSSVREGGVDGILTITLTDAQDVYANMDIEEF